MDILTAVRCARPVRPDSPLAPLPPERKAIMLPGPLLVSLLLSFPGPPADGEAIAQAPAPAKPQAGRPADEPKRRRRSEPPRVAAPKVPVVPAARIRAPNGFRVEMIYSVPRETQGSWVNMTVDPKGRLVVSDQYGKLYRVTPPAIRGNDAIAIEPIDAAIGE